MKGKSIIRKLIITFTSITGGVLILVGLISSFWIYRSDIIEKKEIMNKQLTVVANVISDYLNRQDVSYEEVKSLLNMVCISSDMDAMVADRLGYVYIVSDKNYDSYKYTKIDIPSNLNRNEDHIYVDIDKKIGVNSYIKAIYTGNQLDGYIVMINPNKFNKWHLIIMIWVSVVIAMVIAGIVVNYFAKRFVIDPLKEINNAARRLATGEVSKRVEITSDNEISELAESFNIMAQSIEESDITRKEFISNVSHELRSPITSIKGFVGGILDGIIPRDKENYYLKIVYDEIDRLARLVNDLLDISAKESGKFNLVMSEVNINEIIGLCILNLENKIKSRNLSVKCIFHSERSFVIADRDRIIQVVTNLLENAIKYSNENGQIEVNVNFKGEKIYVSIFNTGNIISKEHINNIWDRFYKSDKSRTNKISMGLGLPIVRLILSQHNEDIWVENVGNIGVKFTFTLKRLK